MSAGKYPGMNGRRLTMKHFFSYEIAIVPGDK